MARAAAMAYPQGLDRLGVALHTNFQKDMKGHALMLKMARPRRFNPDGTITWWDEPELIDDNLAYCEQDVRVECEADKLLPQLTEYQRVDWEFDQIINERGVRFDMPVVEKAAQIVEYAKKRNDAVMRTITDRNVPKCSNDGAIIKWLNGRGVQCTSLAKGEVEDVVFLAGVHMDDTAEKVIKLRRAAWKTSTAKYRAMQQCVSWDGRIRGLINWHGASTGRRAGRLVQPQNFPRVDPDDQLLAAKIAWMHELLNRADLNPRDVYDHIVAVHGELEPLDLLSKALRSMIIAGEGKVLVGGDFSNIEGRVNTWFAGEDWKLQAFIDYDNRVGPDLYTLAYAKSFAVPIETVGKGHKRQIGKVQELALGFQGSVGSYISMGANYGVNPYALTAPVRGAVTDEQWETTSYGYYKKGTNHYGLAEAQWTALKILVDNWREANSQIVQSWWDYQDAAIAAVSEPGTVIWCAGHRCQYYSDGRGLWLILPSGRPLYYAEPEIQQYVKTYVNKDGEERERINYRVRYQGQNSLTKQWETQYLYGGLQCENKVQATAADLLIEGMFRCEAAGYPIILSVHDEEIAEVDEGRDDLTAEQFAKIMAHLPDWAYGLPVTVSAWKEKRYVK
jgi:DNA polymerase bacteriophage-type